MKIVLEFDLPESAIRETWEDLITENPPSQVGPYDQYLDEAYEKYPADLVRDVQGAWDNRVTIRIVSVT